MNTKTRELICEECNVDLREIIKKYEKKQEKNDNFINEIMQEILQKVCQNISEKEPENKKNSTPQIISEIMSEIISKVCDPFPVQESQENPEIFDSLKEFLDQIYSGLGSREDFSASDTQKSDYSTAENSSSPHEKSPEKPASNSVNEDFIEINKNDDPKNIEQALQKLDYLKNLITIHGVKGLQNLGNTCFFNSVMQCLNASEEFVKLLLLQPLIPANFDTKKTYLPPLSIRKKLRDYFIFMRELKKSVYNPEPVLDTIRAKCPKFKGGHQQDAHELLMSVLDKLIDEEQAIYKAINNKASNFMDTSIAKLFGSRLVNKVTCMGCNGIYWVFDPCTVYSLPMSCKTKEIVFTKKKVQKTRKSKKRGKKYKDVYEEEVEEQEEKEITQIKASDILKNENEEEKLDKVLKYTKINIDSQEFLEPYKPIVNFNDDSEINSLTDCLNLFFNKELLCAKNGNSFFCPKCFDSVGSDSKKDPPYAIREYFMSSPPKILILHLKRFTNYGYSLKKNSGYMKIPMEISLDDYLLIKQNMEKSEFENSIENMKKDEKLNLCKYKLYGIVTHLGDMSGGHYIAFAKHFDKYFFKI